MEAADKHYKFINCKTGYAIFYYSLSGDLTADKIKEELEKVRARVAAKNDVFFDTIYWEEINEESDG